VTVDQTAPEVSLSVEETTTDPTPEVTVLSSNDVGLATDLNDDFTDAGEGDYVSVRLG